MVPWNSASGGFAYIWQSKWLGIIAIKTERTQIHFLSDVLVAVASLDLKVPTISHKRPRYPKHQNFPSQGLTVGTSRKRPHLVSDHYHFLRLTVYQFSIVFNLLWATTCRMLWSLCSLYELCYLEYKKNLSTMCPHDTAHICLHIHLHICNKLSSVK